MHPARYVYLLAVASVIVTTTTRASALDVTLDSGAGSQTIVDNDSFDLDITVGTIEFDVTVGSKLAARGRVREAVGIIIRTVSIAAIPPDSHATFRNIDAAAATFTITLNTSAYATTGPPLGWTVYYAGDADDPTPDDVEITANSVEALVQPGPVSVETVVGPVISPPVAPGLQPVLIDPTAERGTDPSGTSTGTRVVFTFTAGPGDEIRIPDSELFNGTGLEVFVYNQQDRCIDRMNRRAEQVTKKAGKAAENCVKDVARVGGGASAPCTSGLSSPKIDDAETRLLDDFAAYCNPVPVWGVNTCDTCISGAASQAVRDLALDIFGPAPIGIDDVAKCQRRIVKDAGRVLTTRWQVFRKCKKSNITSITDDAALVATCLGPPQVDVSVKIPGRENKVLSNVQAKCVDKGITPVGSSAFPGGACSTQPDATFGACVNVRTACRFCLAINVADDIVPALDCDSFDDGVVNSSCP